MNHQQVNFCIMQNVKGFENFSPILSTKNAKSCPHFFMHLWNSMQSHLQCSGNNNISDIKKMVNRIDYWENFTGLCLGLRRHHENLSFFVKIKTRPKVLRKMHRPNFYRSYNKRNCIIECINNL